MHIEVSIHTHISSDTEHTTCVFIAGCPDDAAFLGDKCYVIESFTGTYEVANQWCTAQGATLAIVNSNGILVKVMTYMSQYMPDNGLSSIDTWLGASYDVSISMDICCHCTISKGKPWHCDMYSYQRK